MNRIPIISAILGATLLLGACGDDGSTGPAGAGGAAGATGAGGAASGTHTCADLTSCCGSTMFATAVAKPGSGLSLSQCQQVSSGDNEAACNSLYNGYKLLSACP